MCAHFVFLLVLFLLYFTTFYIHLSSLIQKFFNYFCTFIIKKINPDADSLVIKYHLNQPEVCVYKYKPRFYGKAYELVNNKKLIKSIFRKVLIEFIFSIFLFFLLLAVGCRQRTVMPLLEKAESLMNNSPDSSQLLLESIESPEELPIEEYATWCLLVTQARDKNYVEHTSDSIIDIAVRYFEQKKDSLHYAKALYYKGRIYQDLKKIEEATKLFISSLNIGENINDYSLLFLSFQIQRMILLL